MSNRHDLIIEARHVLTRSQRALSGLLTLLGWGVWFYLWLPATALLLLWLFGQEIPWLQGHPALLAESLAILKVYVLIGGSLGAALVLWSRINLWRFAGVDRRSPVRNTELAEMADELDLPCALLQAGQDGKIVVVRHGAEGGIVGIDVVMPLAADGAGLLDEDVPEPVLD